MSDEKRADSEPIDPAEVDAEGGETVVVDRSAQAEDRTVVVDRAAAPAAAAADAEAEDRTVVVDREAEDRTVVVDREAEDRTVVVDRGAAAADEEDRTVVVDRETDKTVAVERKGRGKRVSAGSAAPDAESVMKLLPTRRGTIRVAPVEPGFGREAVDAVGANAVETYVPREIAPAPEPAPAVPRGEEALRAPAPSMPSVTRRSRTAGVVALLAFAGACVVSVIGIVAVIVWFVRS